MQSSVEFMQSFVNDLLDLRQMKLANFCLEYKPFDLISTLRNIAEIFEPQIMQAKVKFVIHVQGVRLWYEDVNSCSQLLPRLIGDERRLKQVLINLIRNAMKFTQKGQVSISASYNKQRGFEDNILHIQVRDTGAGIAAEDLPKLFTPFSKLKKTEDLNSDGLGLGLTIVKQIVELAGGAISAHSEGLGKGSTFSFTMRLQALNKTDSETSF